MAHLFLAFLYSTRFLSKVATESLGLYCKAFPLPTPLDWTFASTQASSRLWGVGPSRWLFVSQPSGTFYFAVCHAVRHGRPQSLPLSIYSDPPWPSAMRRPNEALLLVLQVLGRGEASWLSSILMEYWISRGQRSCLHSKFSISFMSRQPGDIWLQGEVKREARLDAASYWLSLFFSVAISQLSSPCLPLSASHFVTQFVTC